MLVQKTQQKMGLNQSLERIILDIFYSRCCYCQVCCYCCINLLTNTVLIACKARVITVSSLGHEYAPKCTIDFDSIRTTTDAAAAKRKYNSFHAYCHSKMANIIFANELARRHPDITSVSLHPGRVISETVLREYFSSWFTRPLLPLAYTHYPHLMFQQQINTCCY